MPDLDQLFNDLRTDVASQTVGPSAQTLVSRGRARTRRRTAVIATSLVGAATVGGFVALDHDQKAPQVIATVRPAPSLDTKVRTEDLLYGKDALADEERAKPDPLTGEATVAPHWRIDDEPSPPSVPTCERSSDTEEEDPLAADPPQGVVRQISLQYSPEVDGDESSSRSRREQVVTMKDENAARALMGRFTADRSCGLEFRTLEIGDEAFSVVQRSDEEIVQVIRAVVVRKGRYIVVYDDLQNDLRGVQKPGLRTLAGHEADAGRMIARLP